MENSFFMQCQFCLGNILAGLKNDLLDLNFRCIASPKILAIFPRGLLFSVYIMVYSVHSATNMPLKEQANLIIFRGSRPEVFCKKGTLRNFAKFTEKHLC